MATASAFLVAVCVLLCVCSLRLTLGFSAATEDLVDYSDASAAVSTPMRNLRQMLDNSPSVDEQQLLAAQDDWEQVEEQQDNDAQIDSPDSAIAYTWKGRLVKEPKEKGGCRSEIDCGRGYICADRWCWAIPHRPFRRPRRQSASGPIPE